MKSRRWGLVLAFGTIACLTADAAAQSDRDRRRDLIEGLIRGFVEVQLEKSIRSHAPAPPTRQISPEVIQARTALREFSAESNRLYGHLQSPHHQAAMRPYSGELLQLRTQASVLAQRGQQMTDLDAMGREFQDIDRQWRVLSTRMSQAQGLHADCRQCIQQLDRLTSTLCRLCKIQPQVDYRELGARTNILTGDLQRLVEDLEVELGRRPDAHHLLIQGRRIQQQAKVLADSVANHAAYNVIVAEFRKYQELWQPFAASLWSLKNRYVERSLRRIEEIDRDLYDLLWLEIPINRLQLRHLNEVLMNQVDGLFDQVTLNKLLEIPSARNVLVSSSQFYGVCELFADTSRRHASAQELRLDFQDVIDSWPAFSESLEHSHDAEIRNSLKQIEQTFVGLRDALLIAPAFDYQLALQRAAHLDFIAEHLAKDIREMIGANARYSAPFRAQAVQATQGLVRETDQFQEACSTGKPESELAVIAESIVRSWAMLERDYLSKLSESDHEELSHICERMTPAVVELHSMFRY